MDNGFWLNLQAQHDLRRAEKKSGACLRGQTHQWRRRGDRNDCRRLSVACSKDLVLRWRPADEQAATMTRN